MLLETCTRNFSLTRPPWAVYTGTLRVQLNVGLGLLKGPDERLLPVYIADIRVADGGIGVMLLHMSEHNPGHKKWIIMIYNAVH